ncbi:hypothetical protein ACFLX5_03280 [Chloroflexota bacterium]
MPKKKAPIDLTTDEAMKRLFPKNIVEAAKKVAHEKDPPEKPTDKSSCK